MRARYSATWWSFVGPIGSEISLERGLQDDTNRGFTRHSSGLIGHYAPVGREQVVAGLRAKAVADGRSTFRHGAKGDRQISMPLAGFRSADEPPLQRCQAASR